TTARAGVGRPATRYHPRKLDPGDRCRRAGDADHPDRLCKRERPRGQRHRPATRSPEWGHHRLRRLGSHAGRQVACDARGNCAWAQTAAMMFNPDTAPVSTYMPSLETAARALKVVPIIAPVRSDVEIETAIRDIGRESGGGLVVMPDAFVTAHRAPII